MLIKLSTAIFIFSAAIVLNGCKDAKTEQSGASISKPVRIEAIPGVSSIVAPALERGVLILGDSKLAHWPLQLPACNPCEVEVRLRYRPDGPTTFITAQGQGNIWTFVNSFRSTLNWQESNITVSESGGSIIAATPDGSIEVNIGESVEFNGCKTTLLWAEKKSAGSALYSDDLPKALVQLVSECQ